MTAVSLKEARSFVLLGASGNTPRCITFPNLNVCTLPTRHPVVLCTGRQGSFRERETLTNFTLHGQARYCQLLHWILALKVTRSEINATS